MIKKIYLKLLAIRALSKLINPNNILTNGLKK